MIALAVSLPLVLLAAGRPLLRRMALRFIARRPREALLVVLGGALGTALVTGAIAVGDTFSHSLRSAALRELGPVDEVVTAPDEPGLVTVVDRLRAAGAATDAILPVASVSAPTVANGRAAPRARAIEVDFGLGQFLGPPAESGLRGRTPAPGRAAVSARLADSLALRRGSEIRVHVGRESVRLTVDRILPQSGVAALRPGVGNPVAENLLVAPGTFTRRGPLPADTTLWAALVAVPGNDRSEADAGRVERSLAGSGGVRLAVKRDALTSASARSRGMLQFFSVIGSFGVMAGALFLVNVFALLSFARGPELGMLRALGLSRMGLLGAYAFEGWIYSVAGAAVGVPLGAGLGRGLTSVVEHLFARQPRGIDAIDLDFTLSLSGLERGFSGGALIAFGVLVVTSIRLSRADVIAAIRDLPDQPSRGSRTVPRALAAAAVLTGAGVAAHGALNGNDSATFWGPVLVVVAVVALAPGGAGRMHALSAAGLFAVVWPSLVFPLVVSGLDPIQVVGNGATLAAGGVLLAVTQLRATANAVAKASRARTAPVFRLGLGHPVARPARTGLTLAPLTMVALATAFTTVFLHIVMNDMKTLGPDAGGDYDVVLRSTVAEPVSFELVADDPAVRHFAPLAAIPAQVSIAGEPLTPWLVSAFDERFLDATPPVLVDRGRFSSDVDAYRAVLRDPESIIVEPMLLRPIDQVAFLDPRTTDPVQVGDSVTIVDNASGQGRVATVVALATPDITAGGAWYGWTGAQGVFGDVKANRAFVDVRGSAATFASRVGAEYAPTGAEALTISSIADEVNWFLNRVTVLYRVYVGLGVVVAIAALGVLMARMVRERRYEIGVLRAIGFEAVHIRRSFLVEAGFVAAQAIVTGVGLGVLSSFTTTRDSPFVAPLGHTPTFVVPIGSMAVLVAVLIGSALLAALHPAAQAARIPPAVALRITD